MISDIKRAGQALDKGRTNEALEALLTVWRARRAPEIANAIDALAHAFPAPPDLDWLALARRGEAGDVFTLLSTLIEAGPISALGGRIEMLVERPDDPRIALAFANLALEPPTTSSSNFPVWTKLFGAIEKAGDTRVIPILEKRARMKPGASKFWPKLASWIARALKKVPATPPKLTKEEASAVAAVVRAAKKAKPAVAAKATTTTTKKTKAAAGDPLARAIAAAFANDLHACLEALLDGWRERRLAEYATAIDRVTALHDEGLACPGGSDADLNKAWLALAAQKRPMDVGRLADSAGDGKVGDADKRLETMLTWPEDPRIARAMFLHAISRSFSDRARTWNAVADLLVRNVDVRLADELEGFADTRGENKAHRSAMRRAGPAALKALASVPKEASSNELTSFAKLDAALDAWDKKRPTSERKMLEAILAAPNDNGPALVYADWLTERGHPRGELIVLQCADDPDTVRIEELQGQHARALLGPAASVSYHNLAYSLEDDSFRRGLLQKLELRNEPPSWFFANHPLLWFLETIEPEFGADETAAAVIACSRSLRSVDTTPALAGHLASQKTPLPVESLRLGHALEPTKPLASLLAGIEGPGLSRVKHLELFWGNGETYQDGIPDALVASPLFDKLETLSVATTNLDTALAALKKHGRAVPTLSLLRRHYLGVRLDVALDAKLAPKSASLHPADPTKDRAVGAGDITDVVAALKSLALPAKSKLTLAPNLTIDAKGKAALAKVIALA